jgi:hypothetical protein
LGACLWWLLFFFWSWFLSCFYFFFLAFLSFFWWNLDMFHQVIRSEINRLLEWQFMLIWQGIGLCLMFVVTISANKFSTILVFICFIDFGLLEYSSSESVFCISFSYNSLFTVIILDSCWYGGEVWGRYSIL